MSSINSALPKVLIRFYYALEVMLTCVRWYAAYPLGLRHIEEMMQERGVFVDHVTLHRWAIKVLPVLAVMFRRRKRPIGLSWRMDETYIKISGQWKYLYRAINLHDVQGKITIDKSAANTATIESVKADACVDILRRQNKYLNHIVEQAPRAIKRIPRAMLRFKSFCGAGIIIAGIETMHMIRKGQLDYPAGQPVSAATQFHSLAV
ncbi:DDE-type integrase/transposase/recombinase [Rhodoferax ferrireducens]|uniref:DDE-type integrase/transposase/recombinase n=1 Tax=Rhodoferax ferrireducens TaxID=192843 RepID=UPI000E0D0491|nr:DDE-type integrase/transposase/recombinase [Rhodoferax ferrireducens]